MSAATMNPPDKATAILAALTNGPLSAGEICKRLYDAARQSWADENGFDYDPETEDCDRVVWLLGWATAEERGYVVLHSWQIDGLLRRMEKRSQVVRIQIPGRRPMLWRAAVGVPLVEEQPK